MSGELINEATAAFLIVGIFACAALILWLLAAQSLKEES